MGARGGARGPRGHAADVMAGRCGSARHAGGLRRLGGPARAGGRQVSGPKTVRVRGHASGRRQHRTATEEPVITMIFQNRCWVSGPGVEFTGKGGEEPQSGEERAGRLLERREPCCRAVRSPRGVAYHVWPRPFRPPVIDPDLVSSSGKRGRTMDGTRARRTRDRTRRAWHTGWRRYRFARHYGLVSGTATSGAARICSPMKHQLTTISLTTDNDFSQRFH